MDLSQTGLIFDIVGAMLLSAEAIKVRNVERLVSNAQALISRLVVVRKADDRWEVHLGTVAALREPEVPSASPPRTRLKIVLTLLTLAAAAAAVCAWIAYLVAPRIPAGPAWEGALWALLLLPVVLIGLLITLGVLTPSAFGLLLLVAEASVAAVGWFDRRTADGTVGIIGATLLVIGFVLQFIAAGRRVH